jgi:hypothetical protein
MSIRSHWGGSSNPPDDHGSEDSRHSNFLHRVGLWLLTGTALYTGFIWWRWLVGRMAPEQADRFALQLLLAAVVFLPLLLFVWLVARLLRAYDKPPAA